MRRATRCMSKGLCTDPNLLALYNQLNAANGPRYVYPNGQYPLPVLPAGKPIGVARGNEVVVAVVDSGDLHGPALVQRVVADPARLHGHVPASRVERLVRIENPGNHGDTESTEEPKCSVTPCPRVPPWFSFPHASSRKSDHRISR